MGTNLPIDVPKFVEVKSGSNLSRSFFGKPHSLRFRYLPAPDRDGIIAFCYNLYNLAPTEGLPGLALNSGRIAPPKFLRIPGAG